MSGKPWYYKGLRFQCTGCGGCCSGTPGYVWVNKAEIEAMAAALSVETDKFLQRYVRQVGIRKSLIELPDGDCILLDSQKRACQVYHVRPRQCGTWPFWASNLRTPEDWDETCRECPGANRGPLISLQEIEGLLDLIAV